MNSLHTYSATDIERYHSGQLSPAERHAMEKAALDDPFLADALEGYAFTKSPSTDMAALQQKLQKRIDKDDQKNVFFIGSGWMRIAALFVLFAGGGWLIFKTLTSKNENLATNQAVEKQLPSQTHSQNAADTNKTSAVLPEKDQLAIKEDKIIAKKETPSQKIEGGRTVYNSQQQVDAPPTAFSLDTARVRNDDLASLRSEQMERDIKQRSVAIEKSMAERTTSDTIKNVDVVLKHTDLPLNEVVVLNKKENAAKPMAKRRMQMTVDTLEPAEGWSYFDDYIANNINPPAEIKAKTVRGEVELSFDVNKEGEPVNIAVTKSLCDKCDEEAIRLLKEGPKWNKKAKNGKVKIRF